TAEELWRSVRRRDFSRPVYFFLWMLVHGGYTVGHHWKHITGCEDRVLCKECNVEDSMDHIFTKCDAQGQETMWDLARSIWRKKTQSELVITNGTIMSCGIQPPSTHGSATKRATEIFRRILISQSAHQIWKMRNDCQLCQNERRLYSEREIVQRWLSALNRRLRTDCLLTDRKKYNKKAIQTSVVLRTWQGAHEDEEFLPEDWTKLAGVLVGTVK
ncbi:hypothetical protein IW261DRAFT_1346022, partial [Armillaria novae-zelandiae]